MTHPADTPIAAVELDDVAQWVTVYDQAVAEIRRLEEVRDAARRVIEQHLGDREVGTVAGRPAFRFTYVTTHRLDQRKLTAENPDLVDGYKVPSTSRRFTRVEQ